ncbi:MAG: hypothetical protein ABH865_05030 [Candidatus Omnitrophota bacterium]
MEEKPVLILALIIFIQALSIGYCTSFDDSYEEEPKVTSYARFKCPDGIWVDIDCSLPENDERRSYPVVCAGHRNLTLEQQWAQQLKEDLLPYPIPGTKVYRCVDGTEMSFVVNDAPKNAIQKETEKFCAAHGGLAGEVPISSLPKPVYKKHQTYPKVAPGSKQFVCANDITVSVPIVGRSENAIQKDAERYCIDHGGLSKEPLVSRPRRFRCYDGAEKTFVSTSILSNQAIDEINKFCGKHDGFIGEVLTPNHKTFADIQGINFYSFFISAYLIVAPILTLLCGGIMISAIPLIMLYFSL